MILICFINKNKDKIKKILRISKFNALFEVRFERELF